MSEGIPSSPALVTKEAGSRLVVPPWLVPAVLAFVMIWEFIFLSISANRLFFWYDEILTLKVSGLETMARVWQALVAGADGMPPVYYVIVRTARLLPVDPQVSLRLPSIVGYLLTLAGVFCFTRKRLRSAAAVTAVLLVAFSEMRVFALEARSYALLTGMLSCAAVFWQDVGSRRRTVVGLGLCLSVAVACHHLAVVAIGIFAGAEATWTVWHRHVRRSVWVALLCAVVPFLGNLPIVLHFRSVFGAHFWSLPDWTTAVTTYRLFIDGRFSPAFILCLAVLAAMGAALPGMLRRHRTGHPEEGFPLPDLVLLAGFLLYPATLAILARLMGSGYVSRYGLPAVFGLVVGTIYLIRFLWRVDHSVVLSGALLLLFVARSGFDVHWTMTNEAMPPGESFASLLDGGRGHGALPIVFTPGTLYLLAAEYVPGGLHAEVAAIVDPEEAVRRTGSDTLDIANRILARFVPLRVEDRAQFLDAHRQFLIVVQPDPLDWVTPYLKDNGYTIRELSRRGELALSLVSH